MTELFTVSDFANSKESYSPMFSTVGLQITPETNGIGNLYFSYNRSCRAVCNKLIDIPLSMDSGRSNVSKIVFNGDDANASLAFYSCDAFVFSSKGIRQFGVIRSFDNSSSLLWLSPVSEKEYMIHGYSKNTDQRDPDEKVPFIIGVKVKKGTVNADGLNLNITADSDGETLISFAFEALTASENSVLATLEKAPDSVCGAEKICSEWFLHCISCYKPNIANEKEEKIIATAVRGLLFNTARAQGALSNHLSAFPSRGGYPTHFIWDTYFQNLAYEEFLPELAEDFLLQICAQQRADGKLPQFMCSTWSRPHDCQPALLGWAAKHAAEKGAGTEFIKTVFRTIEKNNEWWLTQRMTQWGVIFCPSGLETGQDDSPRFDGGATLAADMNSYLLSQLKITAEFALQLGKNERADYWKQKADELSENMINVLYCEEDGLFYDVRLSDGERIKIVSPTALMPFWAGINLPREEAEKSIKRYLLNPEHLFGNIPFPSIAYSQDCYQAEKWWRGPTWLPVAWIMLELLEKFGFNEARIEAIKKLYKMLIKDGVMHELFNSQTGEGLGQTQQGWTCAIFIKICSILTPEERKLS